MPRHGTRAKVTPHLFTKLCDFLLDALPGVFHMASDGVGLPHTKAQHETIAESRVGEVEIATAIQVVHQPLILVVAAAIAEADQIQGSGGYDFKARVLLHPG